MFTPPADGRPPTTLQEKRQIVISWLAFPALSVMVFLRRKLGYRQVKPVVLLGTAAGMIFLAPIISVVKLFAAIPRFALGAQNGDGFFSVPTELFALAMLVAGLLQRHARWQEICRGESWHTYSRGIPHLAAFIPLREIDVQRYIDPLACVLVGLVVALVSGPLGGWLMFSGFALLMVEQHAFELNLNRELDLLDGMIASDVYRQTVEHFRDSDVSEAVEAVPPEKLDATAGIPTGIAPDLQARIQKRERRKPPLDDLATPDSPASSVT